MSASTVQLEFADGRPLPRCCRSHPDWPTLGRHLVEQFADLRPDEVLEQLTTARDAVELFELPETDQLDTAELIARHQLSLLTGRRDDVARLDPQPHPGRSRAS